MSRTASGGILVVGVLLAGGLAVGWWLGGSGAPALTERLPGQTVRMYRQTSTAPTTPANPGTLIPGTGRPSTLAGSWPEFRGPRRDNIAHDAAGLLRTWPPGGPSVLWRIPVGEGHAGAVIHRGRVYLMDYDRERKEDAIRCLSLDDGREIWRYTYSVRVKRNHGMSRTVPAVTDEFLVAIGPKCHVTCLRAETGEPVWQKDLVRDFKTTVPPWYAGQCALIDGDVAVIAPGGDPLMMAVELATGRLRWRTPNPGGHGMTHSSIMWYDPKQGRQYVYCTTRGVVGVSAADGRLLWTYPDWRISIANIPSPIVIDGERIFLSGGYDAGSAMVRLIGEGASWRVEPIFRLKPTVFGSEQQTPIYYEGHLYAILPNKELACLDLTGRLRWTSGPQHRFGHGLGPFLLADGTLLVLNDRTGTLVLVSADPTGYNELASAKVLTGHDAWAPMALAAGRLILRDLTELVCLDVGAPPP